MRRCHEDDQDDLREDNLQPDLSASHPHNHYLSPHGWGRLCQVQKAIETTVAMCVQICSCLIKNLG